MPYLQQPNVGKRIRYARSDHGIPIPRPLYDTRLGVESACRQCHRNRSAQQLQDQVTTWYGSLKPLPPAVVGAIAADSLRDAERATRAVLTAVDGHAIAEITGLTQLLKRYARPDAGTFDAAAIAALETLGRGADVDVRALALGILHLGKGRDPAVRRFLRDQLKSLGDRDAAIRNRWVWVLKVQGDDYVAAHDYAAALATYQKAQELAPNDPAVLRRLGVASTRNREYSRAIDYFTRALTIQRKEPQVMLELGFALMQRGDLDSAEATFRRVITNDPDNAGGYANVGLILLRRNQVEPAIEVLKQAVTRDPGLAEAYFLLGRAYGLVGRFDEAAAALRRGLEFQPGNAAAQQMLRAIPTH
jgi:tetratricopeptide (TPR) repeat protein